MDALVTVLVAVPTVLVVPTILVAVPTVVATVRRGPVVSGVIVAMPVVPDLTIVVIWPMPNGGVVGPIVPANVVVVPARKDPPRCNETVAADRSHIVSADPRIADPAPPPIPANPDGSRVGDATPHLEPDRRRSGLNDHPRRLGLLDDDPRLTRHGLDDDIIVGLVADEMFGERRSRNGADEQQRQER
jgi:hypothetical protein